MLPNEHKMLAGMSMIMGPGTEYLVLCRAVCGVGVFEETLQRKSHQDAGSKSRFIKMGGKKTAFFPSFLWRMVSCLVHPLDQGSRRHHLSETPIEEFDERANN